MVYDRLHALALDEGLDDLGLVKIAASLAHLAGISREEFVGVVREIDLEEITQALGAS